MYAGLGLEEWLLLAQGRTIWADPWAGRGTAEGTTHEHT